MLGKSYINYGIMLDMADDFSNWILRKLDEKQWNQAELSRKSGLTRTTISDIISGKAKAGFDSCAGIANAFRMPVTEVLQQAGLIPKIPEATAKEAQLIHMFRSMDDQDKKTIMNMAEFLSNK